MPSSRPHVNSEYESYINLKQACGNISYKSISVEMLSAYFLADFIYNYSKKSVFKKIKRIIKCLFVPDIKYAPSPGASAYGWSIDRPDYALLARGYQEKLGWEFDSICLSGSIVGWRFYCSFNAVLKAVKLSLTAKNIKFHERYILFLACFQAMSFLDFLQRSIKNPNASNYLSFNSSYEYESVLTLYMRSKSIPTYTMQHGMYYQFKGKIPFEMIGMYFSTAETFLAWGEFTIKEIKDYLEPKTKMKLFGHPNYSLRAIKECHASSSNSVLILLPRITYITEILSLIDLLSQDEFRKFEFTLRPHPSLNLQPVRHRLVSSQNFNFSTAVLLDDEFSRQFLCVIGFNTTTMFEAIYYGLPILQYVSGNDEYLDVGFLEFGDAQVLSSQISRAGRSDYPKLDPKVFFG
jgi:hypothetical protein